MVMEIFQGSLGSGKSASMVLDLVDHLLNGGVCAANFSLVDDWAIKLAERNIWVRLGVRNKFTYAQDLYDRFMVVGSCDSLWEVSKKLIPRAKGKAAQQYEGHGRLYLDECQNYFNSREWQKNKDFVHFFSQSRKLKWDCILVAHDASMIDKQIRNFLEYETRFRNMQKLKIPFTGFPLSPIPMFIGISRYAGRSAGGGSIVSRKVYPLVKAIAALYDSALIFEASQKKEAFFCGPAPLDPSKENKIEKPITKKTSPPQDFGWGYSVEHY